MSIPKTLKDYLKKNHVKYGLVPHPKTHYSLETAEVAHVPGDRLAKGVILEDDNGYVMAVIPSTRRVEIGVLSKRMNRRLALATSEELNDLFKDCDPGAAPPVGAAYGIDTVIVDDSVSHCEDVYFESGSHRDLVHVDGENFRTLNKGAQHGSFTRHI